MPEPTRCVAASPPVIREPPGAHLLAPRGAGVTLVALAHRRTGRNVLHLLKWALATIFGAWGAVRAAEAGIAVWIRRETRPRDLTGLAWA